MINEQYYVLMEGVFIEKIGDELVENAAPYGDIRFEYFSDEDYKGEVPVNFSLTANTTKVKWGDFHSVDEDMVSEKLKITLEKFKLYNTKFVETDFIDLEDHLMPPSTRYLLNCHNLLDCLNLSKSKVSYNRRGNLKSLESISLDSVKMRNFNKEQRNLFRIAQKPNFVIISEDIAKELKKDKYNALAICKVSEWNDMAKYDSEFQLGEDLKSTVE